MTAYPTIESSIGCHSRRDRNDALNKRQRRGLYQHGANGVPGQRAGWGRKPHVSPPGNPRGLKARPITFSVPQMLFVALHSIFLEKRAELILKRMSLMMRLLRIDVAEQNLQICRPNRECTTSALPGKMRQFRQLDLQPLRGRSLQFPHDIGDIRLTRQSNRQVHMVRNAADAVTLAPCVAHDRGKICKQVWPHRLAQNRSAILCTEDQVNHYKRQRQRHSDEYKPTSAGHWFSRSLRWSTYSFVISGIKRLGRALNQYGAKPHVTKSQTSEGCRPDL